MLIKAWAADKAVFVSHFVLLMVELGGLTHSLCVVASSWGLSNLKLDCCQRHTYIEYMSFDGFFRHPE